LLREPLVHFLVLGAALFGLYLAVGQQPFDSDLKLRVTSGTVERIRTTWQRQWGRPPSDVELRNLVEQHIREEVLYRAALALGLGEDDTIVRRRLVQKIEFLSEDLAIQAEPDDDELASFLAADPERYRVPARFSFAHVYLSRDLRGDAVFGDAERLLAELRSASPESLTSGLGDRFMLQYEYVRKSEVEIGRLFGSGFGERLAVLEIGDWQGPIESGYGLHLVRVEERLDSRFPALAEIRGKVEGDYLTERRREANSAFYRGLRARYEIEVEGVPFSADMDTPQ
jgi:hypothetical protein